jgi:hypothetical protein
MSDCDETETYSPAAIDIAPAVMPATPAINAARGEGSADATPTSNDDIDTIPSFAPKTAARSQPLRVTKCGSLSCADGTAIGISASIKA